MRGRREIEFAIAAVGFLHERLEARGLPEFVRALRRRFGRTPHLHHVTAEHITQRQPRADKLDARQRTICHADPAYAEAYRRVRVKLDFQRFATVNPEFEGETILYGLTIPSNAPHPDLAAELVRFLIGPEGQQIMAENWQPLLLPPVVDNAAALPEALRE